MPPFCFGGNVYAYFDETGNTGVNVFDRDQPVFITGWVAAREAVDEVAATDVRQLAERLGVPYLHATAVAPQHRNEYFSGLAAICQRHDLKFGFSRIEKSYLVAAKLVDVLFDAVENFGVPPHWYFVRPLRLSLVFALAEVVPEDVYRAFWACLFEANAAYRQQMFQRVINDIHEAGLRIPDRRLREIVTSATDWATQHPDTITLFLGRRPGLGHAPNLAALMPCLKMLEHLQRSWGCSPVSIVHDRTSQFGALLQQAHGIFESGGLVEVPLLPIPPEERRLVEGSSFEVRRSQDSAGLQIVDGALWLLSRTRDGQDVPREAAPLMDYLLGDGDAMLDDLSFENVFQSLHKELAAIMAVPFSEEDQHRGREQLTRVEANRLAAIARFLEGSN